MHILFLTHYYPPEVNAPATRTYEHCARWARAGHEVTVVTCAPNCPDGVVYDGYRNRLRPQTEHIDGIRAVRVWSYVAPNAGTVRRIANYVSFMLSATLACLFLKRPDVVVATSPQFFCGWAGVFVSRLRRRPFLLEIRDIWPESIAAVGALRNRRLLRVLEWLERLMYRAAHHIVTVGTGYRDNILSKVDLRDRISVIYNGVDLQGFYPEEPYPRLLHQWDLEERFVCSYVGTIGMAHGLEVVLEAARLLKQQGRKDVVFRLVGDGARRRALQERCEREGLEEYVHFTGRQPKHAVPAILASSDACLVHLKRCQLFGTVIPSKIFEIMAVGKPIIMGVNGEARRIVQEANAGVQIEPDCAESLAEAVIRLADSPELRSRIGRRARRYVAQYFDRNMLATGYLQLLESVAGVEPVRQAEPVPDANGTGRKAA